MPMRIPEIKVFTLPTVEARSSERSARCRPGLPDIPVTDAVPEHDELAVASHGRGFWVLDNVGSLR